MHVKYIVIIIVTIICIIMIIVILLVFNAKVNSTSNFHFNEVPVRRKVVVELSNYQWLKLKFK